MSQLRNTARGAEEPRSIRHKEARRSVSKTRGDRGQTFRSRESGERDDENKRKRGRRKVEAQRGFAKGKVEDREIRI